MAAPQYAWSASRRGATLACACKRISISRDVAPYSPHRRRMTVIETETVIVIEAATVIGIEIEIEIEAETETETEIQLHRLSRNATRWWRRHSRSRSRSRRQSAACSLR